MRLPKIENGYTTVMNIVTENPQQPEDVSGKISSDENLLDMANRSPEQGLSPSLSHRGLTGLLIVMCLIPVTTILVLWQYLPPVHEGQLLANVYAEGLPSQDFYEVDYEKRPEFEGGFLIVENKSDVDWTHLNIQVNGHYQVYDIETIPAQGEKRYQLSKFLNRTGARFNLQFNELNRVRIYARRPTKDRATYFQKFDTLGNYDPSFFPVIILLGSFLVLLALASLMFRKMWLASEREANPATS
jgi:hypothetical protein